MMRRQPQPLDPHTIHLRREDDPLVHNKVTARLVRGRSPSWTVPTLLLWAGADRRVSPTGSAAFAAAAPPDVVHARELSACYHEILNEPEKVEVLDDIRRWLDHRGL